MATQRLFATMAMGLFLGIPGLANAQFNFTTIDVPGSTRTAVNANSLNAIAGEFDDANGNTHGFVLRNTDLRQSMYPGQLLPVSTGSTWRASSQESTSMPAAHSTAIFGEGSLHYARPARIGPHTGRVPQRGGPGRGSLPRCQPDPSRLHLGQGRLHHVRRAQLGARRWGRWASGSTTLELSWATTWIAPATATASCGAKASTRRSMCLAMSLTVAEGINILRKIAGLYVDADGNQHGFVLCRGVWTAIDVPGGTNTGVFSINALGEIVGSYDDAGGNTHGYVGTPTH